MSELENILKATDHWVESENKYNDQSDDHIFIQTANRIKDLNDVISQKKAESEK